jgi:hypothetical protein
MTETEPEMPIEQELRLSRRLLSMLRDKDRESFIKCLIIARGQEHDIKQLESELEHLKRQILTLEMLRHVLDDDWSGRYISSSRERISDIEAMLADDTGVKHPQC